MPGPVIIVGLIFFAIFLYSDYRLTEWKMKFFAHDEEKKFTVEEIRIFLMAQWYEDAEDNLTEENIIEANNLVKSIMKQDDKTFTADNVDK